MVSDVREFEFRRVGLFSSFWTGIWILITIYLLWRVYQIIVGIWPWWLVIVPVAVLIYMWYPRLAAVKTVTVAGDGTVVFDRHVGRRETHAIYVTWVRPWLGVSRKYFVLRHAGGFELLFEDPEQVARLVRELARLNPDLEVRGVPQFPAQAASG